MKEVHQTPAFETFGVLCAIAIKITAETRPPKPFLALAQVDYFSKTWPEQTQLAHRIGISV